MISDLHDKITPEGRQKTLVVVGAGHGLGMSLAREFGRHGFRVALIARRREALDRYVEQLKNEGTEAAGFAADIREERQVADAFSKIKKKFGRIDVLEFSPGPGFLKQATAKEATIEEALDHFKTQVLGAIASVRQVLPEMIERGEGALLFTTGGAACMPEAMLAPIGIAQAGLRNYVYCLNEELKPKGIYVGTISIMMPMLEGVDINAQKIAEIYYDMYRKHDRVEELFGGRED